MLPLLLDVVCLDLSKLCRVLLEVFYVIICFDIFTEKLQVETFVIYVVSFFIKSRINGMKLPIVILYDERLCI